MGSNTIYGYVQHVKTIDDSWGSLYTQLSSISKNGTTESRDGEIAGEIINAMIEIEDPTRCILHSKIRNLPMRYMIGELLWYLSGNNKLSAIQLYTHAWDRMSDDGETVNSNYGNRIQCMVDECEGDDFDQFKMVEKLLRASPSSRQAVIHIKQARDLDHHPTADVNCTVCLQFFVRENKLYMTTYMRSNDLWMGFPNDVFQFTCMQILLAMKLGYGLGTYTHMVGSLHMYRRDMITAENNIKEMEKQNV